MKKVYLFICLLLVGSVVQAQVTKIWTGAVGIGAAPGTGDTLWNTADNWSPSGVPTSADSVVFTNSTIQRVYFSGDADAKNINFAGSANVIFGIKAGAANTLRTVNVGGTISADYNTTAIQFSGSLLSLTLNAMRTSGTGCGVILKVLTGNKATIPNGKTIHLSAPIFASATQDSSSSGQVNQLVGTDASSITFASGSTFAVQLRNTFTNPIVPFGTYTSNNIVVFQSGSVFSNNTGNHINPFNSTSGPGTAQFLSGSRYNAANGSSVSVSAANSVHYFMGRTYGSFYTGSMTAANIAIVNSSAFTTSFLDSFVVNPNGDFRLTLAGGSSGIAKPCFSFNNLFITSRLATPSTTLTLRSSNTVGATDSTYVYISGNVDLSSNAANTTFGANGIQFILGANTGGNQVTSPQIVFTGNTTLKVTKVAAGSIVNPNLVIGAATAGVGTNIVINNAATLNLGDSLTLRTGTQATRFNIKSTGRLNLIDAARFVTGHNNNFLVESDTTGTGSIGSISSTGSIFNNSVTIQRFIGRNAAWRTIGIPLSTAAPTKLYGGNGTSTSFQIYMNSFTASPAQAYYFNDTLDNGQYGAASGAANAGWRPFTTNNDSISPNRGLLLYGSRNSASPIVLSLTGFINTVDQTIPLSKTDGGNGWNLIANPFLSNISFNAIVSNPANDGVLNSNTIYRVRPLGAGAYSFASYVAGSGTGTNGGSNIIENGAAFFVRAANAGTSLVIRDADKTTDAVGSTSGGVTLLGANDNYNSIRVSLKGANTFSDEVVFVWGRFSKATEAFDNDLDAYDLGASGTHDLSIVDKEGTRYAIFNGADLPKDAETRTYKLATKNLRLGTYDFEVSMPKALDRNNEAYLVDNYLGTAVLVKEGLSHSFQVTADAASKAEGRFQLEVRKKLTSVIDEVATSKTYLLSNPTRNNQFAIHFGSDAQVANWQVVDLSGRVISTGMFKNVYQGDTRVGELKALQSGTYLVRLFSDNEPTVVMKLVKL